MIRITHIDNNKKNPSELIGQTARGKICFLPKWAKSRDDLKRFANSGDYGLEVFSNDYIEKDKYIIVKRLASKKEVKEYFKSIATPVVDGKLSVISNACDCRLCCGTYVPEFACDYIAGARNPRAYFFGSNIDYKYLSANNVGEGVLGEIYRDSDSPHSCGKIREHQEVVFFERGEG